MTINTDFVHQSINYIYEHIFLLISNILVVLERRIIAKSDKQNYCKKMESTKLPALIRRKQRILSRRLRQAPFSADGLP